MLVATAHIYVNFETTAGAPKTFKLRVYCEDFCASARKVRRSLPKGKQGGLDAAIAQKDRKAHVI